MSVLTGTAAIIVTFNRAAKLAKVLDALDRQVVRPEVIWVVDNASTDGTGDLVLARARQMPAIRYLRLPGNLGGAGGFHAGLKAAYAQGANYFWLSDDDAYPEPDALRILQEEMAGFQVRHGWRPAFACSRVEWTDGSLCEMNTPRPAWDWPRFLCDGSAPVLVASCSFVSVLIPRWAVKEHGLPIADYFIWFDDVEYTGRLSRSYPGIFCPRSRVVHDIASNRGVHFGQLRESDLWKYRYGTRNEASFRRREGGIAGLAGYAFRVHRQMKDADVPWRLRRKIYASILRGAGFRPGIERV